MGRLLLISWDQSSCVFFMTPEQEHGVSLSLDLPQLTPKNSPTDTSERVRWCRGPKKESGDKAETGGRGRAVKRLFTSSFFPLLSPFYCKLRGGESGRVMIASYPQPKALQCRVAVSVFRISGEGCGPLPILRNLGGFIGGLAPLARLNHMTETSSVQSYIPTRIRPTACRIRIKSNYPPPKCPLTHR